MYDPLKRDSTWHMVQPGCWIDPGGHGHIFPDEVLAFLAKAHPEAGFDPMSKQDYDMVVIEFQREMYDLYGDTVKFKIVRHERLMH